MVKWDLTLNTNMHTHRDYLLQKNISILTEYPELQKALLLHNYHWSYCLHWQRMFFVCVYLVSAYLVNTFHLVLYTISTTGAKGEILDLKRSITIFFFLFCSVHKALQYQNTPKKSVLKILFSVNQQLFKSFYLLVFTTRISGGRVREKCFMLGMQEK